MNRRLAATLLVGTLLGGCADPVDPLDTTMPDVPVPSGTTDAVGAAAPVAAPTWRLGDWWEYEVEFPILGQTFTARAVVAKDEGSRWIVTTSDASVNLLAEFAHYPTLGPVAKTDLAQQIHGYDIPFFQWPLTDGQVWTGPYRAATGTWTAQAADQQTPRGDLAGFDITMTTTTGERASYGYSPEARWFTQLEFGFPGVTNTRMKLRDWGHNHSSPVGVVTFDEHVHKSFPAVTAAPPSGAPAPPPADAVVTFQHEEGQPMLWGILYGGAPGAYEASLRPRPPAQHEGATLNANPGDAALTFVWGTFPDAPSGTWDAAATSILQQPGGFLFFEVLGYTEDLLLADTT